MVHSAACLANQLQQPLKDLQPVPQAAKTRQLAAGIALQPEHCCHPRTTLPPCRRQRHSQTHAGMSQPAEGATGISLLYRHLPLLLKWWPTSARPPWRAPFGVMASLQCSLHVTLQIDSGAAGHTSMCFRSSADCEMMHLSAHGRVIWPSRYRQ